MSGQTQVRRAVTRGNGEKTDGNVKSKRDSILIAKVLWTPKRRGKKTYYYPRIQLPAPVAEKLGLKPKEEVEFEVRLEQRGGQQVIVLVPQKKAVHA